MSSISPIHQSVLHTDEWILSSAWYHAPLYRSKPGKFLLSVGTFEFDLLRNDIFGMVPPWRDWHTHCSAQWVVKIFFADGLHLSTHDVGSFCSRVSPCGSLASSIRRFGWVGIRVCDKYNCLPPLVSPCLVLICRNTSIVTVRQDSLYRSPNNRQCSLIFQNSDWSRVFFEGKQIFETGTSMGQGTRQ